MMHPRRWKPLAFDRGMRIAQEQRRIMTDKHSTLRNNADATINAARLEYEKPKMLFNRCIRTSRARFGCGLIRIFLMPTRSAAYRRRRERGALWAWRHSY